MSKPITILHITDLHIKKGSEGDVDRRVKSLIRYAAKEKIGADLLLFTGDLAYHGSAEEYELAKKHFIKPICAGLHIAEKHVVFIPGNHDVDQSQIPVATHRRLREITDPREVQERFREAEDEWPRLRAFNNFNRARLPGPNSDVIATEHANGLFSTRIINIRGINLGIASLNSAWLCGDDEDQKNLFLTEAQICCAGDAVEKCHLRLAMVHHPFDWYSPQEEELALADLKRRFDIILTGHLHTPFSVQQKDTITTCLVFTGRAFFDGKTGADVIDGFHLYEVDLVGKTVDAKYRKYIRPRDSFDKDTDHADDGHCTFALTIPETIFSSNFLTVQKLAAAGNVLQTEVKRALSVLQGTETPVFVTPKVCRVTFKNGNRNREKQSIKLQEIGGKSALILGETESGKSILLKTIAGDSDSRPQGEDLVVYVDIASLKAVDVTQLSSIIELSIEQELSSFGEQKMILLIDGARDNEAQVVKAAHDLCKGMPWKYVISIKSSFVADALAQDAELKYLEYFEIQNWGPSRIRELAVKLFEGTKVDVDLAFNFVTRSLRSCDLSATPTVVSLYMSVFPKFGGEVSAISFLRLLEKIEQLRLGVQESSTVDSLYYRAIVLQLLAVECLSTASVFITVKRCAEIIRDYFKPKFLAVNPVLFIEDLCKSGILRRQADQLSFMHFVFFDYYLARGLKSGCLDELKSTDDLSKCIQIGQALALFAGLGRDNSKLAERVLEIIEARFPEPQKRTLASLDEHINHLLLPRNGDDRGEADRMASEDLDSKVDYEEQDEDHENERADTVERRMELLCNPKNVQLDDLSAHVESLNSFYIIFRNLEDIDGELKVLLLDRILDFHIQTNFLLIDFYFSFPTSDSFKSLVAYMLTWQGHGFMASTLGNPSMGEAIKRAIETTQNDFKEFLLVLLLSDFKDPESLHYIDRFLGKSESQAAIEIIFFHLRERMVRHQGLVPSDLVDVFKAAFLKRDKLFRKRKPRSEVNRQFEVLVKETKKEREWLRREGLS